MIADGLMPSPREAMREAVQRALNGDHDGARLWLDIARELRVGSGSPAIRPRPLDREQVTHHEPARVTHLGDESLLPVCETIGPDDPEGCLVSFNRGDVDCPACLRVPVADVRDEDRADLAATLIATMPASAQRMFGEEPPIVRHAAYEQIAVPAEPPRYRTDETVVQGFELPPCAYCGHSLVWITPGPEVAETAPYWAHDLTKQRVCPVSAPDQAHTFATPSVDQRG